MDLKRLVRTYEKLHGGARLNHVRRFCNFVLKGGERIDVQKSIRDYFKPEIKNALKEQGIFWAVGDIRGGKTEFKYHINAGSISTDDGIELNGMKFRFNFQRLSTTRALPIILRHLEDFTSDNRDRVVYFKRTLIIQTTTCNAGKCLTLCLKMFSATEYLYRVYDLLVSLKM